MRHNKKINHLGRQSSHRKAMLANMASSLILHKRISTTVAKAKALRKFVEPLVTKAKNDTTHSRRIVFSYLQNKEAVSELFRDVIAKVGDRPGGYTRILRTETRLGDSADMCMMELVDFNENMLDNKDVKRKAVRRSRRSKHVRSSAPATTVDTTSNDTTTAAEAVADEPTTDNVEPASNATDETDSKSE